MKTTIIGTGRMGTALAHLLATNGRHVTCWDHVPEVIEDIKTHHENRKYFPGLKLPGTVGAELLLNQAVREAKTIFVAVPSANFRHVVKEFSPFAHPAAVVIGVAKGLESGTGKRMSQVYAESAFHGSEQYVALAGPCVATEFAVGKPTVAVLAGIHSGALHKAETAMTSPLFKVETTDDMAGVEWGGTLKNLYAIGMGFIDGLYPGAIHLKAVLMERIMPEMVAVSVKMGAKAPTLMGLAGISDLMTAGFSADSYSRWLGEMLAKGKNFEDAVDALGGHMPEGVKTAAILSDMIHRGDFQAPIAKAIHDSIQHPTAIPKHVHEMLKVHNE